MALTRGGWSELRSSLTTLASMAGLDATRGKSCVDGARRRLGGARWRNRVVEHDCGGFGM